MKDVFSLPTKVWKKITICLELNDTKILMPIK